VHVGRVTGVLELALLEPWSPTLDELLASWREVLAIALAAAGGRASTRRALTDSQALTGRLAAQEEELRQSNDDLQRQQEELRQTNDELLRQSRTLDAQRRDLEAKNTELLEA